MLIWKFSFHNLHFLNLGQGFCGKVSIPEKNLKKSLERLCSSGTILLFGPDVVRIGEGITRLTGK